MELKLESKNYPTAVEYGREVETQALIWFLSHRAAHLQAQLLTKNFRTRGGEIDLVFEEMLSSGKKELVFVEVRARGKRALESGIESITPQKLRRLNFAIQKYLSFYQGEAKSIRIDVLSWDETEFLHYIGVR